MAVLEAEVRRELKRLGVPLAPKGPDDPSTGAINFKARVWKDGIKFGACVWKQESGEYEYAVSLAGPWPTDQMGDVEDMSYWPWEIGTVSANGLRAKLLEETRRVARRFVRAVRIGPS
jgi:hypothetical protein